MEGFRCEARGKVGLDLGGDNTFEDFGEEKGFGDRIQEPWGHLLVLEVMSDRREKQPEENLTSFGGQQFSA